MHRGHINDESWIDALSLQLGPVAGGGSIHCIGIQSANESVEHHASQETDVETGPRQRRKRSSRICVVLEHQRHTTSAGRFSKRRDIIATIQEFRTHVKMRVDQPAGEQVMGKGVAHRLKLSACASKSVGKVTGSWIGSSVRSAVFFKKLG